MTYKIRLAAIAASLALHGALLLQTGGSTGSLESPERAESITRLSFSKPAPVPESMTEKPQPEPEIKPEPKPEPEKKALKKAKELPKEEKPEPTPPAEMAAATPAEQATQAPQLDEGMVQSRTKAYLATVIAHIERHKWYPKAARRRGIQGHVEVEFMLLPDGTIRAAAVDNGPELLLDAARKTLERAAPLPQPPPDIHCPIKCSFRMQFALDGG